MLLTSVVSSLSLPILEIENLYQTLNQKLCKSQKRNPQQNFQYHSRKLSYIGFHYIFID